MAQKSIVCHECFVDPDQWQEVFCSTFAGCKRRVLGSTRLNGDPARKAHKTAKLRIHASLGLQTGLAPSTVGLEMGKLLTA